MVVVAGSVLHVVYLVKRQFLQSSIFHEEFVLVEVRPFKQVIYVFIHDLVSIVGVVKEVALVGKLLVKNGVVRVHRALGVTQGQSALVCAIPTVGPGVRVREHALACLLLVLGFVRVDEMVVYLIHVFLVALFDNLIVLITVLIFFLCFPN